MKIYDFLAEEIVAELDRQQLTQGAFQLRSVTLKRRKYTIVCGVLFAFCLFVALAVPVWTIFAAFVGALYCILMVKTMNKPKAVFGLAKKYPDSTIEEIILSEIQHDDARKIHKKAVFKIVFAAVVSLAIPIFTLVNFTTSFQYEPYNDGYRLVRYTQAFYDKTEKLVLPDTYEGKAVVAVDDKAFYNNKKLEEVVLCESVTELGASVFKKCTNLKRVTLGNNVTTIGGECFKDCKSLVYVNLPDSITEIRGEAFYGCKALESITLPAGIVEIRGNTFENCESLKSIEIPFGVTRIAAHAFYRCSSLSYVAVPDSVTEIGSSAFRRCDSLKEIVVPENAVINERAFKESPTEVKRKLFTDEMMSEIIQDAYKGFMSYAIYNTELGKDKIYCYRKNTIVIATSEKFKETYLKNGNKKNDIFLVGDHEETLKYLQKAKDAGVTKVMFYAYSEKATKHIGEPYFLTDEYKIDDFISSLEPYDEE